MFYLLFKKSFNGLNIWTFSANQECKTVSNNFGFNIPILNTSPNSFNIRLTELQFSSPCITIRIADSKFPGNRFIESQDVLEFSVLIHRWMCHIWYFPYTSCRQKRVLAVSSCVFGVSRVTYAHIRNFSGAALTCVVCVIDRTRQ